MFHHRPGAREPEEKQGGGGVTQVRDFFVRSLFVLLPRPKNEHRRCRFSNGVHLKRDQQSVVSFGKRNILPFAAIGRNTTKSSIRSCKVIDFQMMATVQIEKPVLAAPCNDRAAKFHGLRGKQTSFVQWIKILLMTGVYPGRRPFINLLSDSACFSRQKGPVFENGTRNNFYVLLNETYRQLYLDKCF